MASGSRPALASAPPSPSSTRPYAPPPAGPSHAGPSYMPASARPVKPRSPPQPTQPTTVKLNSSGLRNLAFRLIHPPEIPSDLVPSQQPSPQCPNAPAKGKGKARWWSDITNWGIRIQPQYQVSLEDVLARKHLPPLGLKDFEEWLLFVDGTPENLYFILWLREYTARYQRWTSSLKSSKQSASKAKQAKREQRYSHDLAFSAHPPPHVPLQPPPLHHPGPIPPSSAQRFPPARERPYASLGLAISSISVTPPPHAHSQPSSPTAIPSPTTPGGHDTNEDHEPLDEHDTNRTFRPYAPSPPPLPPNPSLALFYLRAKETFIVPDAPYELNVGSEVLGTFFSSADEKGENKRSRHESENPYDALRNLSSKDLQRISKGAKGLGGKLPPPPDPAVFEELKEIVEARLKASLARLVVATYNNVGMSRAYCGSAGGIVIGIITSGPPLIASFSLQASRWFRLFALPGMWLGLTIFISAMYGVCMMIYIFGDLRQLRSFELARPAISKPKPLNGDPLSIHRDSIKNAADEKGQQNTQSASKPPSPAVVTFTNPFPTSGGPAVFTLCSDPASTSSDRRNPGISTSAKAEPAVPRKMSLPTGLFFGSRARAEKEDTEHEKFERMLREAMTPLTQPPLMPSLARVRSASVNDAAPGSLEPGSRPPTLTIVPPERVRFGKPQRQSLDSAAIEVAGKPSHESIGEEADVSDDDDDDEDRSSVSSYDSSDSGTESDDDEEEPVSPRQRPRRHRRRRRPVIEVSDAFYDEHPSPEGPATAPADWFPSSLERAARMNPIRDCPAPASHHMPNFTYSNGSSHLTSSRGSAATNGKKKAPTVPPGRDPMWPDYEGSNDNHSPWAQWMQRDTDDSRRAEQVQQQEPLPGTAMFIRPFPYDEGGGQPWMAGQHHREDDVEKGLRGRAAAAAATAACEGEFDFDGLPPRTTFSLTLKASAPDVKGAAGKGKGRGSTAEERASSPAPSHSTRSDIGSAIDVKQCGWLMRRWWNMLESVQRHCSPENVVEVLRRRRRAGRRDAKGGEDEKDDEKGETDAEKCEEQPAAPPAQPKEKARTTTTTTTTKSKLKARPADAPPAPSQPEGKHASWHIRLRRAYLSVPAFAAPLTPVLNPLVGRAQWVIVVRSAAVACAMSVVVVGGLLGVPE